MNTIVLKGRQHHIRKEGVTDEAVTPGHLLEYGGTNDVRKHSSAGGNAQTMFAVENDVVGRDLDDAYAAGESVQYDVAKRGSEISAFLAYGENVAKGAMLESAGDGSLQAHTEPDTDASSAPIATRAIVAQAIEPINNNSGGAAVRIKVEVL